MDGIYFLPMGAHICYYGYNIKNVEKAMFINNFWGILILFSYYIVTCLIIPVLLKRKSALPDELIRKTQHLAYSLSIFIQLYLFNEWYMAVFAASLLVLIAYPALYFMEKLPFYKKIFVERGEHSAEFKTQLLWVQISFALLISFFWGFLGPQWKFIIAAGVMAWGFGDAAAALIGKSFGKRIINHKKLDGKKTYEGAFAMGVYSAIGIFITLVLLNPRPWYVLLVISVLVAPVCSVVELFSKRGSDTLTVPFFAAGVMYLLFSYLTHGGW